MFSGDLFLKLNDFSKLFPVPQILLNISDLRTTTQYLHASSHNESLLRNYAGRKLSKSFLLVREVLSRFQRS